MSLEVSGLGALGRNRGFGVFGALSLGVSTHESSGLRVFNFGFEDVTKQPSGDSKCRVASSETLGFKQIDTSSTQGAQDSDYNVERPYEDEGAVGLGSWHATARKMTVV